MVLPNARYRAQRQFNNITLVTRQKVVKNGRTSHSSGSTVAPWSSDGTYPGTVGGSGTGIMVSGTGPATINVGARVARPVGSGSGTAGVNILVNGGQVGYLGIGSSSSFTNYATTLSVLNLQDGDLITLVYTGAGTGQFESGANTYIEVVPTP